MRKRIVLDLVGDFAIICSIVEVLLFCIYYFIPRSLPQIALSNYITQYYWIAALGSFLLILLYFCFWAWICFKRADVVRNGAGLSDAELFSHFKDGKKCCNYRVNGDFVFVNTSHGIFCMTKSDIHEHKMRRVHHTKRTRYTRRGYTYRMSHDNDYYTYHFELKTRYGTFKNVLANYEIMQDVNKLFK